MSYEQLQRIMKTLGANFTEENTLLIKGIKGKFSENGNDLLDEKLIHSLKLFADKLYALIKNKI